MPRKKTTEKGTSSPYNHSLGEVTQLSLFSQNSENLAETKPKSKKPKKSKPEEAIEAPAIANEAVSIRSINPSSPPPGKHDCALCNAAVITGDNSYKCALKVFGGEIALRLNWGMTVGCDRFQHWQVPDPFIEATVIGPANSKGKQTKGKIINHIESPDGSEAITIQWENNRTHTYTRQQVMEYGYKVSIDDTEADIWSTLSQEQGGDRHE